MQGNFCSVIFCFLFLEEGKTYRHSKNFIIRDSSDSNLHFYDLMLAGESQSAHHIENMKFCGTANIKS